jgi:hypothetical protein
MTQKKYLKSFQRVHRFKKDKEFENKEGYKFLYRNKKSCSFTSKVDIYGSCVVGVRDTNFDLAKELFVYSE